MSVLSMMYITVLIAILCTFKATSALSHYSILGVRPDADAQEIKKTYRRLALEMHPDKLSDELSEEERTEISEKFLKIQAAYEVLSDPELRVKYDLSLEGIEYHTKDNGPIERYMSGPFALYARNKRMKLFFRASFDKPGVPPIMINIPVPIADVYHGVVNRKVTFYRSVICDACKGTGGEGGAFHTCDFCKGNRRAFHIYDHTCTAHHHHHHNHKQEEEQGGGSSGSSDSHPTCGDGSRKAYGHITETQCGVCGGKGYIPDGSCEICKGTGSVMQKTELTYSLPIAFIEGSVIEFNAMGHQDTDGAIGDVKLQFSYQFPPNWRRVSPESLDLICDVHVQQKVLLSGANITVSAVNGETIKVS